MSSRAMRQRLPLQDRTNAARNIQPIQQTLSKKRVRPSVEDLIDDGESTRSTRRRKETDVRGSLALSTPATLPQGLSRTKKTGLANTSTKMRSGRMTRNSLAQDTPDKEQEQTFTDVFVLADSNQDNSLEPTLGQDSDHDLDSSDDNDQAHTFSFTGTILQATPLAAEMSARALKSFKRRPRQPSMLQMVRQRIASARQSTVASIKTTSQAADSYDLSDDIEDDFAPDLAGTPQQLADMQTTTSPRSSKVRKLNDTATPSQQRATRSSQRQKLARASETLTSQSPAASELSADFVTAQDVGPEQQRAADTIVTSTEEQAVLASPDQDDIFADPVSQTTPSPARGRRTRQKVKKVPSTADLQALLPRRRRAFSREPSAARSVPDLDSGDELVDDQDSGFTPRNKAAQNSGKSPGSTTRRRRGRPDKETVGRQTTRRGGQQIARKTRDKASKHTTARCERQRQPKAADEEDLSLTEDLAAAKKKFAQIDEWELDFENITPEETSSPSQDYR